MMMMKKLYKTLSKTPVRINPSSLSFFSTKIPEYEQQSQLKSHIEQNNESGTEKVKAVIRPSEIPYQSKVANWVNLIGSIKMPVRFLTCDDGSAWAGTLISKDQSSSSLPLLWIPVIFQGDLAYTAKMHLKEKDMVFVAGHLSPEPLPINLTMDQRSVQVMVHDVHFVCGLPHINPFTRRSRWRIPGNPMSDDHRQS